MHPARDITPMQMIQYSNQPVIAPETIAGLETRSGVSPLSQFIVTYQSGNGNAPFAKSIGVLKQNQFQDDHWKTFMVSLYTIETTFNLKFLIFKQPFLNEENVISLLKKSPGLQNLQMGGKSFKNTNLLLEAVGKHCLQIQSLNVSESEQIDQDGFNQLTSCTHLREINLSGCPGLADENVERMAESAGDNIQDLILFNCPELTDQSIHALIGHCSNLKYLNIGLNQKISLAQIGVLVGHCQFLKSLFLEGYKIESVELSNWIENQHLEQLSLRKTDITDEGLLLISEKVPNLTSLNLSECRLLSFQGVVAAIQQLTQLNILDLRGCFSANQIREIGLQFPLLKLIYDFEVNEYRDIPSCT